METAQALKTHPLDNTCSRCSLSEICLCSGLGEKELARLDQLLQYRKKVRSAEHLFRAGDTLHSLFAIRSGFFKTYLLYADGRQQVTGFQMCGEIVGMDAISQDEHTCYAIALEDSEVCDIPFARLEELAREMPALQRHFHRLMSREIVRDQGVMLLLGAMRAEERVAALLLNLSQRYLVRGYSAAEFRLRMTRKEIGSYLGLKIETVSRIFTKLQVDGLIAVRNKTVTLKNIAALRRLLGEEERVKSRLEMSITSISEASLVHQTRASAGMVFVVENDESVRELLITLLESEGFEVEAWDNAEAFRHELNSRREGCLLLDIELPGMSGLDLAKKIAVSRAAPPLILMSGRQDLLEAAKAMQLGAVDFVSKPFDVARLLQTIRRSLTRSFA